MDYSDRTVKKAVEVLQSFSAVNKTTAKFTLQNADQLGLSILELSILNTLFAFPDLTLLDITKRLQFSASTSESLESLAVLKLIEMIGSEDGSNRFRLTAKGEALSHLSSQNAFSYRAMVKALDEMEHHEVEMLLQLHRKLLHHLESVEFASPAKH